MKTPVGQLDPSVREVHIWGAGVAGLLMAHHLSRQGYFIHLYEKSSRIGGKICSHQLPQGVIEEGPNAIYATKDTETWLASLGLTVVPARAKLKRRIWNKKPLAPLNLFRALKLVVGLSKKTPPLTDETTVADFFRPLLGRDVENLLSPALQGIYGCQAHDITVTSIWPGIQTGRYKTALSSIKGPRARSISFPHGMQEFIDALAKSIQGKIHLNYQQAFSYRPNTVICTDAHSAAELLKDCWSQGSRLLNQIEYLPLQSAAVIIEPPKETQRTFGYLFPRESGIQSLGALFNKEIFPGRTGVTFIVPGDSDASNIVTSDLQKLHWPAGEMKIHQWKKALPIYNFKRLNAIRELTQSDTRPKNLVLFGNYVAGISLRDMIRTASEFSSQAVPN